MKKHDLALIFMGIAIAAVTIAAIILNGTPMDNQRKALDQQKVQKMETYKILIENFYSLEKRLPNDLKQAQSALSSIQPELDQTIEYKPTESIEYQLCTTFESASEINAIEGTSYRPDSGYLKNTHQQGYDCHEYRIPQYLLNSQTPPPIREPAVQPVPVQ